MTDKELRKLTRAELLEMLISQGRDVERMRQEIDELKQQLADKSIAIENSGSIAEAALKLSGIFENAQKAADQYLLNIKAKAGVSAAEDTPAEPKEDDHGEDA